MAKAIATLDPVLQNLVTYVGTRARQFKYGAGQSRGRDTIVKYFAFMLGWMKAKASVFTLRPMTLHKLFYECNLDKTYVPNAVNGWRKKYKEWDAWQLEGMYAYEAWAKDGSFPKEYNIQPVVYKTSTVPAAPLKSITEVKEALGVDEVGEPESFTSLPPNTAKRVLITLPDMGEDIEVTGTFSFTIRRKAKIKEEGRDTSISTDALVTSAT